MAQNVMTYNAEGRRITSETHAGQVTTTAWDCCHLYPLGNATVYEYNLRGHKTLEYGATYPVRYTYDVFGNKTTMTTFREGFVPDASASGDTTIWLYDEASNCMTNKVYADGKGPNYRYTPDGKLAQRVWARGVTTDYFYDAWGNLTNTVYSDGTPSVTLAYDAMGRQTNAVDAAGVATFAYDSFGSPNRETISGLYSKNIVRHYDAFGRSDGYTSEGIRRTRTSYESATGRIGGLKSGGVWFDNHYLAGTDLRDRVKYGNSGYAYYTYETNRNILAQARNEFGGSVISQYDYVCVAIGSRVEIARSGTMMSESRNDAYGYNERNELISASKLGGSGFVPTTEYAYQYDDIGNRIESSDLGTNRTYTANGLNQYTHITGSAGVPPAQMEDFSPAFDLDGNQTLVQTSTGIWSVTYNGENRPVLWSNGATNISMKFDRMGRRVEYLETVDIDGVTTTNTHHRFVYDGYLCIQRLNAGVNNSIDLIFAWDPAEPVTTRPLMIEKPGKCMLHVTHDGNKNVSDLVFFSSGSGVAAHYEYAPFGALTAATRNSASTAYDFRTYNPFRFSSEYADDALELVYYNYRHYEPQAGMWLSRDPYFGVCDNNGYLMCGNEPLGFVDVLGLWSSVGIGTHQYMVARGMRQAIRELENKVACLNNRLARMLITSAIVDGNERMDDPKEEAFSAPTAAALPLHYNRAMAQKPEDAIRRFNDGVRERRKFLEELQKFEFSTPSDDTCKAALDKLGQLTHMLQDYYGHGVGWDYVVGSKDSLIGNAYGEPDMVAGYEELLGSIGLLSSFVLKPSSYSGMFHKSEHGPLWWREPGYRAPDTEKRKKLSIEATAKEMERFLPIWCDKCCKTLERMRSER